MKKYISLFLIISCIINIINAQVTKDITEQVSIKNLHKVDEGVYRSSQPNKDEFKQLEEVGIKEILNLRRLNSDNDKAEGSSLILHHIKMRAGGMNEKDLIAALQIIKNRKGEILIHCHHGSDRTGAVVAMYKIIYQGWTKEEAINEMKDGGYGFHSIYRNIPKLINKINIEEFKKKLDE